ncbi:response regulator [Aeromicrobium sp.]|uniref:response regulator n=1 Tax=Aeromicrobium sp. TaxID=1871063 RepID=UPI003D6BD579
MTVTDVIRTLIVDDNAIVRMGLRNLLDAHVGIEVVGEAVDGEAAVRMNAELDPDVVLCDVRMPGLDGVGAATQMSPTTNVVMLTYTDDLDVIRGAMAAGAKGYLVHGAHQPDEIVAAVVSASRGSSVLGPAAAKALLAGQTPQRPAADRHAWGLTTREAEVMEHVATGKSNREIARVCFLAEKTVKNHLNNIFPKLGVTTRAEAISLWLGATGPNRDA